MLIYVSEFSWTKTIISFVYFNDYYIKIKIRLRKTFVDGLLYCYNLNNKSTPFHVEKNSPKPYQFNQSSEVFKYWVFLTFNSKKICLFFYFLHLNSGTRKLPRSARAPLRAIVENI